MVHEKHSYENFREYWSIKMFFVFQLDHFLITMPKPTSKKDLVLPPKKQTIWKKKRRDELTESEKERLEKTKERIIEELNDEDAIVADDIVDDTTELKSTDTTPILTRSTEELIEPEQSLLSRTKRFIHPDNVIPDVLIHDSPLSLLTYDAWGRIEINERNLMILYPYYATSDSKGQSYFDVYNEPPHDENPIGIPVNQLSIIKRDYEWDFGEHKLATSPNGEVRSMNIEHDFVTKTRIEDYPLIVKLTMIAFAYKYIEMETYMEDWKKFISEELKVDDNDEYVYCSLGANINTLVIRDVYHDLELRSKKNRTVDPVTKVYYFHVTMAYNGGTRKIINQLRHGGVSISEDYLQSIEDAEKHLLDLACLHTRVIKSNFFSVSNGHYVDHQNIFKITVKQSVAEGFDRDHPHLHVLLEFVCRVPSNTFISYDLRTQAYPMYLKKMLGCNYVNIKYQKNPDRITQYYGKEKITV